MREWRLEAPHPKPPSVRQAEALHSTQCVYVINFTTSFSLNILQFCLLCSFVSQAQRVPARKHHVEANGAPARKNAEMLYSYKASLSLSFFPDVIWLFFPQQWISKRLQWKNGLHREYATPGLSPCLPWSECVLYVYMLSVQYTVYVLILGCCSFLEVASVIAALTIQHHTRAAELQNKLKATPGGEEKNHFPVGFYMLCKTALHYKQ